MTLVNETFLNEKSFWVATGCDDAQGVMLKGGEDEDEDGWVGVVGIYGGGEGGWGGSGSRRKR